MAVVENDVIFEGRTHCLADIYAHLFCLDNPMFKLLEERKQLNKKINNHTDIFSSSHRKELKSVNKKIGLNLWNQRDFTQTELDLLVGGFKEWVNEYLLLHFDSTEDGKSYFFKASKRGNNIYRGIVQEKLNQRTTFFDDPNFDKLMIRRKKGFRDKYETNILFVTLTCNPNIFMGSRKKAWLSHNYFYNKFITRFRKKYGRCWVLRGMESTKDGYPHTHLMLICENSFDLFIHQNKKTRKKTFRAIDKPKIAKCWNSYIDIVAPSNVQGVKDYISKDIIKQYGRRENNRTSQDLLSLALCWIFRKQSYAISGFDRDLISVSIIQTQIDRILNSNQEKKLIYKGIVKISFSFPYLSQNKGKPPPDSFSVMLSEEQRFSLRTHRICEFRSKNVEAEKIRDERRKILFEKHSMNQFLDLKSKEQRSNHFEKRFSRCLSMQDGEKIELDLDDKLNLLAFGRC